MFFWILFIICFIPLLILYPTKVIGKKKLPKGRYILAVNHQSNHDAIILIRALKKKFRYLGKKELFKNKFGGAFLKSVGVIPVDRGNVSLSTMKYIINIINKGGKLVIFPTGTRTSSADDVDGLKQGMAMFALKTNTNIVPVVIDRKHKLCRRVKVVIGDAIDVSKYSDKKISRDLLAEVSDNVSEKMKELLEEAKIKRKGK